MAQHEFSLRKSTGMEKVECAICPPGRRREAIPNKAKQSTIHALLQIE
jgi:hypothetical protein